MRKLTTLFGSLMAFAVLVAMVFSFVDGASWSTLAYMAAGAIIAAGLLTRSLDARQTKYRGVTRVGLALLLIVMGTRACTGKSGNSVTMTTTAAADARWLGRILDEGDLAVAGARLIKLPRMLRDPDLPAVPDALRAAYRRMRAAEGDVPSPVLPTYLELQSPASSDVVIVDAVTAPRGALIFLHGFGGNFTLPCWQLAQAARAAGLVTYCPAVSWAGDWWAEHGRSTLEKTVALARKRGFDRLYLAGLSNGAAGAARLAPRLRGVFRGLILISGAPRIAEAPGVPVLVIQGRRDQMAGVDSARTYAARVNAQYVELEAGHFALLLREEQAMHAITTWLQRN